MPKFYHSGRERKKNRFKRPRNKWNRKRVSGKVLALFNRLIINYYINIDSRKKGQCINILHTNILKQILTQSKILKIPQNSSKTFLISVKICCFKVNSHFTTILRWYSSESREMWVVFNIFLQMVRRQCRKLLQHYSNNEGADASIYIHRTTFKHYVQYDKR